MMNKQLALSKKNMLSLYKRYSYWWLTKKKKIFFYLFILDISNNLDVIHPIKSIPLDTITFKIDHSDGRQIILTLPSTTTTLKNLYKEVAERLSLPSISLVYNNQTLKLDDENQLMTLKQLNFSSNNIQLLESYPLIRKIKIFIQTSNSSSS